jgi:preprotein translocase subunit SecG
MTGFLIVIHTIVSLLLIAVVLMQASQGGGLSGTFGGNAASSVLGGQNAGNVLSRVTTWLATLFLVLAVVISVLSGPSDESTTSLVKRAAENRPEVPALDVAPPGGETTLDLDGGE